MDVAVPRQLQRQDGLAGEEAVHLSWTGMALPPVVWAAAPDHGQNLMRRTWVATRGHDQDLKRRIWVAAAA